MRGTEEMVARCRRDNRGLSPVRLSAPNVTTGSRYSFPRRSRLYLTDPPANMIRFCRVRVTCAKALKVVSCNTQSGIYVIPDARLSTYYLVGWYSKLRH